MCVVDGRNAFAVVWTARNRMPAWVVDVDVECGVLSNGVWSVWGWNVATPKRLAIMYGG